MEHKCRRLKKILSMALSTILIVGLIAGAVPIRAMAEEDVHTNTEEVNPAEGNGIPSEAGENLPGGDGASLDGIGILPDSSETPAGGDETSPDDVGTLPKTEEAPGVGNDMTPSAGAAGDGQQSQDSDGEYYVVSFYSDGVLQETREVRTGEKLSAFPEPVKEGYQFIGWAIAEENGEDFDPDIAITQTMDLYAKWEILVEAMLLEEDVMPVSAQEVSYSTDGGSTWKEGTLGEALNACQSASQPAEIKLLQDITLTGDNWDSPRLLAERSDVTIDGQGYTITRGEGAGGTDARRGSLLMLNQPRTVTLKNITIDGGAIWQGSDPKTRINVGIDCSNQGSLILVEAGGTLILEAGTVLQNNDVRGSGYTSGSGGAIRLGGEPDLLDTSKGKVIMKSGAVIRDNTACGGGGVFINMGSVFELQGGIICGNYARTNRGDSGNGGGVYNSGTFIMTDGEVSGNVAYDGAGLYNGGTIATAQMSGGSISNNVALRRGGGVQCGNNKFSMSGGSIFGNKSGKDGGGIGVDTYGIKTCQIEISGGSIVDNTTGTSGGGIFVEEGNEMKVSGNPVITGNTKNGEASNLYLESGDLISLMGAMTQGASIGVTYGSTGQEAVFSSGWTTQMGEAEKPENYFSSDRSDFIVVKDAATNEAKLVRHTHVFGTEWKWDDGAHWHECDCGARIDQEAHREDDGTVTKEPTETEAGEKKYQCIVCGHERTEILPATGSGNDDNQGGGENQGGDGNNQGGNGNNQGGDGNNQGGNGENQGGDGNNQGGENLGSNAGESGNDNVGAQNNENAEAAEAFNESAPAPVLANGGNVGQNEVSGGETEPKTGDGTAVEVYATIAMIAGLLYLLSYFDDGKRGMTEAEKRELITKIIQWSRQGGYIRTGLALAAIFLLLVYYHSIGKKAVVGWKAVYGK